MSKPKSGVFAIVLSAFWTGLGQLYVGRAARGVLMMLATPVLWMISFGAAFVTAFMFAGVRNGVTPIDPASHPTSSGSIAVSVLSVVLYLLPIVWWVWGMGDAKRQCDAMNRLQA
ncbi:MAG: hypothetical protein OEV00_00085 [Acidobacteriota bacterium]|nr:hypothetical protein [Acidobacteriota bacterium]MDH3783701.1 hypothetical protein [Acidobacteriota bacterium]